MAGQAAKTRPDLADRLKRQSDISSDLYAQIRNSNRTAQSIQAPVFSGGASGSSSGDDSTGNLKKKGDTMFGPLAFYPSLTAIVSGAIDISSTTTNYSSRVIISPETGSTDDLVTITGAAFSGQLLFLQGVSTRTITLKTTGNIETIDGTDFDIVDDDIIVLMYDITDTKWQQITTGKQFLGKPSPLTTKGDLWAYDTADTRLGVGTDGQVLTADSTQASGLKWATGSAMGFLTTEMDNLGVTALNAALIPDTDNTYGVGDSTHSFSVGYFRKLDFNGTVTRTSGDDNFRIHRDTDGMTFQLGLEGTVEFGKWRWADKDNVDRVEWDINSTGKLFNWNYATGGFKIRTNATDAEGLLMYPRGNSFSTNDMIVNANYAFSAGQGLLFQRQAVNKMRIAEDIFMLDTVNMGGNGILSTGSITNALDSTYDIGTTSVRYANIFADVLDAPSITNNGQTLSFAATGLSAIINTGDSFHLNFGGVNDFTFVDNQFQLNNSSTMVMSGSSNYFQQTERTTDPSAPTAAGIWYVKDVGGVSKPYFIGDGTSAVDLSSGGSGANTTLSNLTSPTAINQTLTLNSASHIIPTLDLGSDLGDATHSFSLVYFRNLFLDDPNTHIKFSSNNMVFTCSSANDIVFTEAGTEFGRMDGGLNQITWNRETEFNADVRMDGGNVFRSHDSTQIGFLVTNSTISTGTEGTVQIPWLGSSSTTKAGADTDFGAATACIGINEIGGTPTFLVRKSDGSWWGVALSSFFP